MIACKSYAFDFVDVNMGVAMRRLCLLAVLGLAPWTSSATAQVTGIVTNSRAALQFNPGVDFGVNGLLTFEGTNVTGHTSDGGTSDADYDVVTVLEPNNILFTNGVTANGGYNYSTTTTSIKVTFTNDGPLAVRPQLESTIFPGGFGFYISNTVGCGFLTASCPQVSPASGIGFANLTRNGLNSTGTDLGGASFVLDISSDGGTLIDLGASMRLDYNAADPGSPFVVTDLTDFANTLDNFRLATPITSISSIGYHWDQTDILVDFPPGLLAPGDSETLTYTTTVSTYARSDCDSSCTLVSVAGFGDPIGKSGGPGTNLVSPNDLSSAINYTTFAYEKPTFDGRILHMSGVAVPELADWCLMLAGLGLVGVALRRRHQTTWPAHQPLAQAHWKL